MEATLGSVNFQRFGVTPENESSFTLSGEAAP